MHTPRYLRFALALLAGASALTVAGCQRRDGSPGSAPPGGGLICSCPPDASPRGDMHPGDCTPAERAAGCRVYYNPGGPLPPPELAA